MKNIHIVVLLFLIVILASALRIWNISTNPAGFFVDEASHGLEAHSILTTGKDTNGKVFPVIFKAVGDYRDPVLIYSTIPFVYFFGLNEFSVRITSAVYGILAVIMIYFVGKEYFNERIGLWSALLLAISPWHVLFSRVGFQLIASVFWILFTLYFLHKSFNKMYYYALAAFGLLLSFFSYSTTKMYIPFLVIFHIFTYISQWRELLKKKYVIGVSILLFIITILLLQSSIENGDFFKRWNQVDKQYSIQEMLESYRNHFSPKFLFITGDAEFPNQQVKRHSIHGLGELYWFQLIFLVTSMIVFIISKKERMKLLFWMLFLYIYPLGTIFTSIEPQASRSILGVIPFTILTAYGIEEIARHLKTRLLKQLYYASFLIIISVTIFLFSIALKNYPLSGADYWGWQYGYKESVKYALEHQQKYQQILITHRFNMGIELLSFYNKKYYCNSCGVILNPIEIDVTKKQLFILRADDIKEAANLYPDLLFNQQSVIKLPNGTPELFIGEFIEPNSSS